MRLSCPQSRAVCRRGFGVAAQSFHSAESCHVGRHEMARL